MKVNDIHLLSQLRTKLIQNMTTAKKRKKKAIKRIVKAALRAEIIKKIKSEKQLIANICSATDKSYPTVMRWLDLNLEQLTMEACLSEICSFLHLDTKEVLA